MHEFILGHDLSSYSFTNTKGSQRKYQPADKTKQDWLHTASNQLNYISIEPNGYHSHDNNELTGLGKKAVHSPGKIYQGAYNGSDHKTQYEQWKYLFN